jgi:redox-sensitive bicupin YhaK (pirin superfamily)
MTNDPILMLRRLGFQWETADPFLFCVHHVDNYPEGNEQMGPAASLAGRRLGEDFEMKDCWRMYHGEVVPGFPQHPHRGFETVTIVRRGLIDHTDSMGAAARYGHGDVQWLTAGSGINHAEMFPLLDREGPNPAELFQIWLNLPRSGKFADPHFTMFWAEDIPKHVAADDAGRRTEVTVIAGAIGEAQPLAPPPESWAASAGSDVAIWTLRMEPGARFTLPAAPSGTNRRLYFFNGDALRIAGRDIPSYHSVELVADVDVELENGPAVTELLLLQGRPIGEPVVQRGPFVMNTEGEIRQTFLDYQRTQFGGWPWPTSFPVHAREEGRFAIHADGTVERPRTTEEPGAHAAVADHDNGSINETHA